MFTVNLHKTTVFLMICYAFFCVFITFFEILTRRHFWYNFQRRFHIQKNRKLNFVPKNKKRMSLNRKSDLGLGYRP